MAEQYAVLGQGAPGANAESDLLTVPATASYIISTLMICNRGDAPATFRVAACRNGVATANHHYLYYDATIGPKVTLAVTIGITLDELDVIRVRSSTADLSFNAFGTVVTP